MMKRYREADVIAPKIQKPDRNWDKQQAADNRLRDLLEWLEFADNLEEAELVASAHISRESNSEPPREVASGKHSIFTHFQRPQLRGLQENQDYKGSLQEALWRSSTSRRKIRSRDNSGLHIS